MAAINFPASPGVNDTHTEAGLTWTWTGTTWDLMPETTADLPIIQDENDVEQPIRKKLKFVGHDVVDQVANERIVINRQHESHYRFELVTTIDQDVWLKASTIFSITKTAGVATAEYKINAGAWVPISFTGNTWTGTLNIAANDVMQWRITYTGGYITCALIVQHKRTL